MSEEQMRILKMIEEKKITAEDGAKLLNALSEASSARDRAAEEAQRARSGQWNAGSWAWSMPEPPMPPIPPIPPMPPMPPLDPFAAAFGRSRRDRDEAARDRERARRDREEAARERERNRRGRRDTEPLDSESGARFFRIRVTDTKNGHTMVNVNLPVGLINFGLKLINRYVPDESDFDPEAIAAAIQQGAVGQIIDIQQGAEGEPGTRVQISVDG